MPSELHSAGTKNNEKSPHTAGKQHLFSRIQLSYAGTKEYQHWPARKCSKPAGHERLPAFTTQRASGINAQASSKQRRSRAHRQFLLQREGRSTTNLLLRVISFLVSYSRIARHSHSGCSQLPFVPPRPLQKAIRLITQGLSNTKHETNTDCSPPAPPPRRTPHVALQCRMGILPERRTRPRADRPPYPRPHRPRLS